MAVSEISSGLVTFSASEGDGYGLPEGRHYSTIVVVPEQKTGCTNGEHGPLCILQFGTINPLKDRRVVLRYFCDAKRTAIPAFCGEEGYDVFWGTCPGAGIRYR